MAKNNEQPSPGRTIAGLAQEEANALRNLLYADSLKEPVRAIRFACIGESLKSKGFVSALDGTVTPKARAAIARYDTVMVLSLRLRALEDVKKILEAYLDPGHNVLVVLHGVITNVQRDIHYNVG